jgi:hypothetical protein
MGKCDSLQARESASDRNYLPQVFERTSRKHDTRNAAGFQFDSVVDTPRSARPSITNSNNDCIAPLYQVIHHRLGEASG